MYVTVCLRMFVPSCANVCWCVCVCVCVLVNVGLYIGVCVFERE